jgi:hypothetical protein
MLALHAAAVEGPRAGCASAARSRELSQKPTMHGTGPPQPPDAAPQRAWSACSGGGGMHAVHAVSVTGSGCECSSGGGGMHAARAVSVTGSDESADERALWRAGRWKFATSVVLALVFGLFSEARESYVQVALVLGIQLMHVVVLWGVLPLQEVGWLGCVVHMEELALLTMAALLLMHSPHAPQWLMDGMVWMFPVIICTMTVGDAVATGALVLRQLHSHASCLFSCLQWTHSSSGIHT